MLGKRPYKLKYKKRGVRSSDKLDSVLLDNVSLFVLAVTPRSV